MAPARRRDHRSWRALPRRVCGREHRGGVGAGEAHAPTSPREADATCGPSATRRDGGGHAVKACAGKAATRGGSDSGPPVAARMSRSRSVSWRWHARAASALATLGEAWHLTMARVRGLFGSLVCGLHPAPSGCGKRAAAGHARQHVLCRAAASISAGRDVLRAFDNMLLNLGLMMWCQQV